VPCSEIVGVAEDVRWTGLRAEPRMLLYASLAQADIEMPMRTLLVRPRGDPRQAARSVQQALLDEAPRVGFARARPLQESVDPELRPWQVGAGMFTLFGLLALVIAAVGLYSVLAYVVAQRAHEVGVRMALGATRGHVLRLVLGEGLRVTAVGVALGLAAALVAGRYMRELLVGVSPRDPLVLGGVAAALLAVATLASLLPAWSAARVDPSRALRAD
jgi:ABC-type antimicrobial peptide transport system permease subunit